MEKNFKEFLLLCLLLSLAHPIAYFNATFDNYLGHQATYDLGYLSLDTNVIISINSTATGAGSTNISALSVQL